MVGDAPRVAATTPAARLRATSSKSGWNGLSVADAQSYVFINSCGVSPMVGLTLHHSLPIV
jgi:hypothetical protein